jgi:hypothetical protein
MGAGRGVIDPVTSRVVRDTTIKHTLRGEQDFLSLFDKTPKDFDRFSLSKRTAAITRYIYKIAKQHGVAVGRILVKSSNGGKHDTGILSWWGTYSSRLSAHFYEFKLNHFKGLPDVDISRHAIERVSERLGTIDTQVVRNELAPAVISIGMTPHAGRGGWAKTQHGMVRYEFDLTLMNNVIVTFISDEQATGERRSWEWTEIQKVCDTGGRVVMETPSKGIIYTPRADI